MARDWTRDTGTNVMSFNIAEGFALSLESVRVHCNSVPATSENLTVTLISAVSSIHNTNFLTQDMNTVSDLVYQPDRTVTIPASDSLAVRWTNTNSVPYGIEVIYGKGGL